MSTLRAPQRASRLRLPIATFAACAALLPGLAAHGAPEPPEPPAPGPVAAAARAAQLSVSQPAPLPTQPARSRLHRWLEVQTLSADLRTRFLEDSGGRSSRTLQYRPAVRAKIKADQVGRLALHVGAFSGNTFAGGWNHTGLGASRFAGDFALKQLFLAARPVSGVEAQFGSLGPFEGENTEITAWDNDAYLTGTRLIVTRPRWLYLDHVAVTRAYVGDFSTPNVFRRLDRFDEPNLTSVLVSKRFGPAALSGSYQRDRGAEVLFQGLTVRSQALRVVDAVRIEQYVRLGPHADVGFAVTAERAVSRRLKVGGGWADIDPRRGGLNGDRFDKGRRLIATGSVVLTPELTLSWFYTRGVRNATFLTNRQRAEVLVGCDVLALLSRQTTRR